MLSEFQWKLAGKCKHCGGDIYHNEDEGQAKFFPAQPGCCCELRGQPETVSDLDRGRRKEE
jgi:hypothetical protein